MGWKYLSISAVVIAVSACGDVDAMGSTVDDGGLDGGLDGGGEPALPALPEIVDFRAVASAYCDLLARCQCSFADFEDIALSGEQCEQLVLEGLFSLVGAAYDAELVYDPACGKSWQQLVAASTCDGLAAPIDCRNRCTLYYGSVWSGQPCQELGFGFGFGFSECSRGLVCNGGECRDPCSEPVPTGGSSCDEGCPSGQFCDQDDQVCRPLPGPGESCMFSGCAPGLRCDQSDPMNPTCEPLGSPGDRCMGHTDCADGYCPAGFCQLPPGVGQSCELGICGPGAACDFDSERCVASPQVCNFLPPSPSGQ